MNRLSVLLLLSLAMLVALIGIQLERPLPAANPGIAESAASDVADDPGVGTLSFALPPLASLTETVQRPLFLESRTPAEDLPVPVETVPVSTAERPSFSLSAIVITSEQRAVLVSDPASGSLIRLREGESLAGWTLKEVGTDRAMFTKDGESQSATLRRFERPPPVQKVPRSLEEALRTPQAGGSDRQPPPRPLLRRRPAQTLVAPGQQ